MERYTLEDHEVYRKEQDEKATKEADERRERTEKETARRAWLADGGNAGDAKQDRAKGAICEWASTPPRIALVTKSSGSLRISSPAGISR
jgi:hypothetical protein